MLLVSGDSFAEFTNQNVDLIPERKVTGPHKGKTLGEQISRKYNVQTLSTSLPGGCETADSFNSIKYMELYPVTHLLYYVTHVYRVTASKKPINKISEWDVENTSWEILNKDNCFDMYKSQNSDRKNVKPLVMDYNNTDQFSSTREGMFFNIPVHHYAHWSLGCLNLVKTYCDKKNINVIFLEWSTPSPLQDTMKMLHSDIMWMDVPYPDDGLRNWASHLYDFEHNALLTRIETKFPEWIESLTK